MTRLRHMLNGAIAGALLCLAIGMGIAAIVLAIGLPYDFPMDRWYDAGWIVVIAITSSALVGMIAGAASGACVCGLSMLQSVMIVAATGVVAVGVESYFILFAQKKPFFLWVPLGGVVVGGIVVVLAGIVKTRRTPRPKQEDEDSASEA